MSSDPSTSIASAAAPVSGGGPVAAAQGARPSLVRSSLIFSGLTLVSRVFGFARDLAVAAAMGASSTLAADAWNTALAFPNLFRRIFAEGAFAAAFVPAYAKSLATDGEEVADVLAADAMATLAAATLALTVVAELTMPWLMMVISPGFAADPEKYRLAVVLTQITMPYLPCMAIYAHLSGVLNARGRFILSAGAPILLNLWTLAVVLPAKSPREAALFASMGVIAAGISQAALLWWGVRKSGARVDVRWPRLTPDIRRLIGLAVPGAIAASASQLNIFLSGVWVSGQNGARTWLAVCDRLYMLPQGLVGVAIGVALLPQLSRAFHGGDGPQAKRAMDQAITFSMALTLPAAAAMIAIPYFLCEALYVRGQFNAYDAGQTAGALFYYGLGVPAFVLQQLYSRAFFARGDTRTPMRFALVSIAVNIVMGGLLFQVIGVRGIALATSVSSWLNVGQMALNLHRQGHYQISREVWGRLIRILIASTALGLLLFGLDAVRPSVQPHLGLFSVGGHRLGGKEVAVALTLIGALVLYPPLLLLTGGQSWAEVRAALRRQPARPSDPQSDASTLAEPPLEG